MLNAVQFENRRVDVRQMNYNREREYQASTIPLRYQEGVDESSKILGELTPHALALVIEKQMIESKQHLREPFSISIRY